MAPVKTDLGGAPTDLDTRRAYARALLDHHYRRQAEMSEEAENQKRGDHDPAFLEARSIAGGREPPRLLRDCLPKRPAYMGERKEGLTQRDPIAARVIAGVCIAMCGALAKEGADLVADTLTR